MSKYIEASRLVYKVQDLEPKLLNGGFNNKFYLMMGYVDNEDRDSLDKDSITEIHFEAATPEYIDKYRLVWGKELDIPEDIEIELIENKLFVYCISDDGLIHLQGDLNYYDEDSEKTYGLFQDYNNIEIVDISKLDTSEVTNMKNLFENCENLKHIDISNLDTSKVKSTCRMFRNCVKLDNIDLSKNSMDSLDDTEQMFSGCYNIKNITFSNDSTPNLKSVSGMFSNCRKLEQLDLGNINSYEFTSYGDMFKNCGSLNELICKDTFINNLYKEDN